MTGMPDRTTPGAYAKWLAEKRFFGGLLMATGGMIATLCGSCTLWAGALTILSSIPNFNARYLQILVVSFGLVAIFGGLPTAVGVLLFRNGRRLYREGRPRSGEPWKAFE